MNNHLGLIVALGAGVVVLPAAGQTIGGIVVNDSSSINTQDGIRRFANESTLSPVTANGVEVSFTHRMAAHTVRIAEGGAAQVYKRNLVFEILFTVEDPAGQGYTLNFESLVQNISTLTRIAGGGGVEARATGLVLDARYDDVDDGVEDFEELEDLFGQITEGVSLFEAGHASEFQSSTEVTSLGPYTGTNRFAVRYTTVTGPTTNVVFPNGSTGSGDVNLGLGGVSADFPAVDPDDLGHFLTVTAVFNPTCAADLTGDGVLNFFDVSTFLTAFNGQGASADLAEPTGVWNFFDVSAFLALFGAGCP